MKLIIFSGFLGAGKTMLILSLARYLSAGARDRTRLVIIENEAGQTGIDDRLIKQAGYEVRSLLSGCICCTLSADLVETLSEIKDKHDPEYVVFEPTGLAFPARITDMVQANVTGIEWVRQLTVVDAQRWDKLLRVTPDLMTGQVGSADVLLLNKCDLMPPDALDATESRLREMNSGARLWRCIAAEGVPDALWDEVLSNEA